MSRLITIESSWKNKDKKEKKLENISNKAVSLGTVKWITEKV